MYILPSLFLSSRCLRNAFFGGLIILCFDQMDVRGALGDLFQAQLKALLP